MFSNQPAQDGVSGSEVVLLAVPRPAVEQLCAELPVGNAVVVDATNPRARGRNPDLGDESGTEAIARWLGSTGVVKAFNTTGAENMADADYGDIRPAS